MHPKDSSQAWAPRCKKPAKKKGFLEEGAFEVDLEPQLGGGMLGDEGVRRRQHPAGRRLEPRPEERFLEGPGTQLTVYKWPLPVDSTLHKGTRARGSAALKKWVCLFPIQKPKPLKGPCWRKCALG